MFNKRHQLYGHCGLKIAGFSDFLAFRYGSIPAHFTWVNRRIANDAASMTSAISVHIYEVRPRKMMNSKLINLV